MSAFGLVMAAWAGRLGIPLGLVADEARGPSVAGLRAVGALVGSGVFVPASSAALSFGSGMSWGVASVLLSMVPRFCQRPEGAYGYVTAAYIATV